MQESRRFAVAAENVGAARRFVAEVAARWDLGDLEWPLVQVVSELASNAIIHARTDFTVCLAREGDAVRIEVVDASARRARARTYDLDATTGRGLRLVDTLSREWGVASSRGGKTVWAVVDAAAEIDDDPDAVAAAFLGLDDLDSGRGGAAAAGDRRPHAARLLAA